MRTFLPSASQDAGDVEKCTVVQNAHCPHSTICKYLNEKVLAIYPFGATTVSYPSSCPLLGILKLSTKKGRLGIQSQRDRLKVGDLEVCVWEPTLLVLSELQDVTSLKGLSDGR